MMRAGILALQGAFAEHRNMLERLGADCVEIRQRTDFRENLDALVLPGGESTVMKKLLTELELLEPIRKSIEAGMPVMGTCAADSVGRTCGGSPASEPCRSLSGGTPMADSWEAFRQWRR